MASPENELVEVSPTPIAPLEDTAPATELTEVSPSPLASLEEDAALGVRYFSPALMDSSSCSDDEPELPPAAMEEDGIPRNLRPLIFHARDSLTYQALCGIAPRGLNQAMLTSIVNDLRRYIDIAVDSGLIDEAGHVQRGIDVVRGDRSGAKLEADREVRSLEEKIAEAKDELVERRRYWNMQQAMAEREREMALADLAMDRERAAAELYNEWQSARKRQQYSKPSAGLLNMRHMAKKMIRAKQFDDVRALAALIDARQRDEVADATRRMNADYQKADQQLAEKFDVESGIVVSAHEMKIHSIARAMEHNLRPILQRIQNLEKLREAAVKVSGSCAAQRPTTARRGTARSQKEQGLPALLGTPKLALPTVTRIKRENTKSQMNQQPAPTLCRPPSRQRT
jgi:hypothetical protein